MAHEAAECGVGRGERVRIHREVARQRGGRGALQLRHHLHDDAGAFQHALLCERLAAVEAHGHAAVDRAEEPHAVWRRAQSELPKDGRLEIGAVGAVGDKDLARIVSCVIRRCVHVERTRGGAQRKVGESVR